MTDDQGRECIDIIEKAADEASEYREARKIREVHLRMIRDLAKVLDISAHSMYSDDAHAELLYVRFTGKKFDWFGNQDGDEDFNRFLNGDNPFGIIDATIRKRTRNCGHFVVNEWVKEYDI